VFSANLDSNATKYKKTPHLEWDWSVCLIVEHVYKSSRSLRGIESVSNCTVTHPVVNLPHVCSIDSAARSFRGANDASGWLEMGTQTKIGSGYS
jgi:hypothetical protein